MSKSLELNLDAILVALEKLEYRIADRFPESEFRREVWQKLVILSSGEK